jgi:hypothetical protein
MNINYLFVILILICVFFYLMTSNFDNIYKEITDCGYDGEHARGKLPISTISSRPKKYMDDLLKRFVN